MSGSEIYRILIARFAGAMARHPRNCVPRQGVAIN
jgi:hypothetical protein